MDTIWSATRRAHWSAGWWSRLQSGAPWVLGFGVTIRDAIRYALGTARVTGLRA